MSTNLRGLDKRYLEIIAVVALVGILSHGMAMFNHYYYHDGTAALEGFSFSSRIAEGRWFLCFLSAFEILAIGTQDVILPLIVVCKTLLVIALLGCVMVKFLKIESTPLCVLIGGVLAAFPSVASLFGYMHIAFYYMIALLMGSIGVLLAYNRSSKWNYLISIILMACSLGTYQAYIPFYLGLILCKMINMLIKQQNTSPKEFCFEISRGLSMLIIATMLYFLVNTIILNATSIIIQKATYFSLNPVDYLYRIPNAYKIFFSGGDNHVLLFNSRWYYILTVFFIIIYGIIHIKRVLFANRVIGILLSLLFLLIPIFFNFIYIMCPSGIVYSLMEYNFVLPFVFLLLMIQSNPVKNRRVGRFLRIAAMIIIVLSICSFVKIDNMCYLKAEINKHRAISYFTTLISEIKTTDGFNDGTKVLLVNPGSIDDTTIDDVPFLENIEVQPYRNMNDYLNDYDYEGYWYYWCGYAPQFIVEYDTMYYKSLIDDMPPYPTKGSIRICGDTVIVKLGNKDIYK